MNMLLHEHIAPPFPQSQIDIIGAVVMSGGQEAKLSGLFCLCIIVQWTAHTYEQT